MPCACAIAILLMMGEGVVGGGWSWLVTGGTGVANGAHPVQLCLLFNSFHTYLVIFRPGKGVSSTQFLNSLSPLIQWPNIAKNISLKINSANIL